MKYKDGFTLLEMSIVLALIGLLIAAIVVGNSMVRAAQLQTMLAEYDSYVKAIKQFQDKYLALPGDMLGTAGYQPTDMWGTDPVGCPDSTYSATPYTTTCNGDGNGTIGNSDANGTLSVSTEWWRAWQHLANAGLIPGQFTGVQGSGGAQEAKIGVNVPASAVKGGGW